MVENLEKYQEILKWGALQGFTDTPFPSSSSSASSSSQDPDFEQQEQCCLGFSLEIAVFPDSAGGRGLAATRDLKKGETILRVPKGALLSVLSAKQDKKLAEALVSHPSLSSTQVLCIHLLREVAKGQMSEWYPYLVHLPRLHHTLAHYTDVESQALQVEEAVWVAERAAETVRRQWSEARPLIKMLSLGRRFDSLHAWLWASATVSSRTLFVPWDKAGTLCPIGDYFNYACPGLTECDHVDTQDFHRDDDDAETNLEEGEDSSGGLEFADRLSDGGFESERNEYCFYARQNYKKGQQVLLCYGTYTNLELLEHYGFLLLKNPNDKFLFQFSGLHELGSVNPGGPHNDPKNLYIDCDGHPSFSLLAVLRLRAAPIAIRKSHGHLALSGLQISPQNDTTVYQWLKIECEKLIASFPTSSNDDCLLLKLFEACTSFQEVLTICSCNEQQRGRNSQPCGTTSEEQQFPKELPTNVLTEFRKFEASVSLKSSKSRGSSSNPTAEEAIVLERWKLAVNWRLAQKRIIKRCILLCACRLKLSL